MSFPQIETELKEVKEEIREINESIKQLIIQIKLINMTFEGILKPSQKKEYNPIEIKFPEKIIPNSDDEKYIQRYRDELLKEESLQKAAEEQNRLLKAREEQSENN